MLVPDRRRRLLELVQASGSVRIDELAPALGVSVWTVRRDLGELEAEGVLRRAHGGAYLPAGRVAVPRGADPEREAKARIAALAATRLRDGATVMVLSGSTTAALLPHLVRRRLTVVTNGLEVAMFLKDAPDVSVVVIGGYLHREQMTLIGPMTEAAMADLHVDVIVAGAYGVDPAVGVTGAKIIQAGYRHGMLRHTESLMVLADATKLGRRGPTLLAETGDVDLLVTDDTARADHVSALRTAGVEVVLA